MPIRDLLIRRFYNQTKTPSQYHRVNYTLRYQSRVGIEQTYLNPMIATAEIPRIRTVQTQTIVPLHVDYLDGIRAVAALYVVIHHAFLQIPNSDTNAVGFQILEFPFRFGRFAVDLFIVLSGFCLMLPVVAKKGFLKNGAFTFFKNRARRILPTYYFALLFSMLMIFFFINEKTGTQWDVSIPVTQWDIITHILLIQDIFYDTSGKINHVFWSISVEWRIYVLFPLLLFAWRKWGPFRTVALALLGSTFLWYALTQTSLNFYSMSPHYLALFSFGMAAAYISRSSMKRYSTIRKNYRWNLIVLFFFSLIVLIISSPGIQRHLSPLYTDLIVGSGAACFLIALESGHLTNIRKTLSWKPLVFIGTFAYSIYLIHAPLLQLISQFLIEPLGLSAVPSILLFWIAGIPLIVGGAYLFYLFAERPFLSKQILRRSNSKL